LLIPVKGPAATQVTKSTKPNYSEQWLCDTEA